MVVKDFFLEDRHMSNPNIVRAAWTISIEIAITTINGLIAIFLARRFSAQTFSQYVLIISAVSSLTMLTLGIRSSIAHAYASQTLEQFASKIPSRYASEFRSIRIGLFLGIIWLLFAPLISYVGNVSIIPVIFSTALIPFASLGSLITGRMQGERKFFAWRMSILISTFIQLPLVYIAATLRAPLSLFIILLIIPSALFSWVRAKHFRPVNADIIEQNFPLSLAPGVTACFSMLGSQLPLLLVRSNFDELQIGPIVMFIYGMGILSAASGVLGSYLLPKFVQSKNSIKSSFLLRTHAMHATPLLCFFGVYVFFGSEITRIAVGTQYVLNASTMTLSSALLCFFIWSIQSSLLQERMSVVGWSTTVIIGSCVSVEAALLFLIEPSIFVYFLLHALFGLVVLIALNLTTK